MKVKISKKLNEIYSKQHKNYDYAVSSAMNYMDPDSFAHCFEMVDVFKVEGDQINIEISDNLSDRIKADFGFNELDDKTIGLLVWLGAILPEV